jgi:hypothetical protein
VTVRFGNVLGSNGSVIPLFVEQLKRGGPLTVTHPDVRRYFMLIPEAVQLVLHAAAIGELNSIYVLDMGEPIRLIDLARDLIRLSGFRADEVPITIVGLRPGEKLDEELVGHDEVAGPSQVESVMQVRPRFAPDAAVLSSQMQALERAALRGNSDAVIAHLKAIVPEFGSAATAPLPTPASPSDATAPVPAARPVSPRVPFDRPSVSPRVPVHAACGACASPSLHRSHASGALEQVRRHFTAKRPYRCYQCGWRGWIEVVESPIAVAPTINHPPDLGAIDVAFSEVIRATRGAAARSELDLAWLAPVKHRVAGNAVR